MRTASELEPPLSQSSTKISQSSQPPQHKTNTNFTNRELKIGHTQDSNWDPSDWEISLITTDWEPAEQEFPYWEPAVQLIMGKDSKKNYVSIHKVLGQPSGHFISLKPCKSSQIPHPSPRVTSASKRNALNYANSLAIRLRESSRTPGAIRSWTNLPSSFL